MNLFKLAVVAMHAAWSRVTLPRSSRMSMMNEFALGWALSRSERFDDPFGELEAGFLANLWALYVGPGGQEFADRWGSLVDRKIQWRLAQAQEKGADVPSE